MWCSNAYFYEVAFERGVQTPAVIFGDLASNFQMTKSKVMHLLKLNTSHCCNIWGFEKVSCVGTPRSLVYALRERITLLN